MNEQAIRLSNHAATLVSTKHRLTGLAMLKRAVALAPLPGIQANLAIAHTVVGDYYSANEICQGLIADNPRNIAAWHALGVMGLTSADPDLAVRCFEHCQQIDPGNQSHIFDHSLALMQAGRWQAGWSAYEDRRNYKPERIFPGLPRWDGSPNQSVYVWAEQGLGDTFQFARFLPILREKSRRVVLAIPPSLYSVFEAYKEFVDILAFNTPVGDIDAEISLMSLPFMLNRMTPDKWPEEPGLLGKNVEPMSLSNNTLKIGMCWACGPSSHHHLERSVPLSSLIRITENAAASFYSLQIGEAAAEIHQNAAQTLITDLSPALTDDWVATASAIKAMDMVVSTDTSVAHLAASLKKPTIMLLARRDWWRWGNTEPVTPWYPSMTIIRQSKPFQWDDEVAQVSAIIGKAAQDRSAKTPAA